MTDLDKAVFLATIPPIMTGIKAGGEGLRVQFDIPETYSGEGIKLFGMKGKILRITVEVEPVEKGAIGTQEDDVEFG